MASLIELADRLWTGKDSTAEPESREVHKLRAAVYGQRVSAEPSTMSRGIFAAAARDSNQRSGTT